MTKKGDYVNIEMQGHIEAAITRQQQYRPVTAYTATRPILVNGVDINTGLYPVLNFQPTGAQYPYIYVPIAEFSRVGARVVWDEANQLIRVTTDYYQLRDRERELIEENARLRAQLGIQSRGIGAQDYRNQDYTMMNMNRQQQYRPVTAYTATRPVLVNGVDINTGLYPVLNFQPTGAQYPYIYVPIAEFSKVGARVIWDDISQTMRVTTDYYQLRDRVTVLEEENAKLRELLEPPVPIPPPVPGMVMGNTAGNIMHDGFVAQQGQFIYYSGAEQRNQPTNDLFKEGINLIGRQKLTRDQPDPYYINVIGDWIYFVRFYAFGNDPDRGKIFRIGTDGTNLAKVSEDVVGNMLIVNDWIYYSNSNDGGSLYKMRLDGSGKMKLNNDRTFSINVVGDWIYYQNVDDGNTLHRVTINGESRQKLGNITGTYYIVHTNYVYFINLDDERRIYRVNLDGSNPTRLSNDSALIMNLSENYIFYTIEASPPGGEMYRMRLDGSERTSMNTPYVTGINIHGDWVYYRSFPRDLSRIRTTGEDRTLIFDV